MISSKLAVAVASALADDGEWHLQPTGTSGMARLMVVVYGVAAWFVVRALLTARRARRAFAVADAQESRNQRSIARLWVLVLVVLAVLAVNRLIDLQGLGAQMMRDRARADGWYDSRRPYQVEFAVGGLIVALIVSLALARVLHAVIDRVRLTLVAFGLMLLFVLLRAS